MSFVLWLVSEDLSALHGISVAKYDIVLDNANDKAHRANGVKKNHDIKVNPRKSAEVQKYMKHREYEQCRVNIANCFGT